MDRPEFLHPRLRMSREPGALEIVLPVNAGTYRRLLDSIWLLVGLSVEGLLVATLAGRSFLPGKTPVLALLILLIAGADLFLLLRCLWYWTGQERFVVQADRLVAAREILGMGAERIFLRSNIESVKGERLLYRFIYPSWGRFFVGNGNGQLVVDLGRARVAYGRGLEVVEAERLAELLAEELKILSARRPRTELRPR